jgi:hypothetical protein
VIDLSERTGQQIRAVFVPSDVDTVERVLVSRCGSNLPGLATAGPDELERVRSAAVRLSAGSLKGLSEAIQLAELDWRDLLVAAGFADDPTAHTRWMPRPFNADVINDWLAGGCLPGVAFSQNDPVIVKIGSDDQRPGSVISLEALEPEPRYLVELGSGEERMAFQRQLMQID